MPFDGSGNYIPASAPNFPAVAGSTILAQYYNAVINDVALALNTCFTRDGQVKPTAAINWNNQNLTGVNNFGAAIAVISGNATVGGTLVVTGAFSASNFSGTSSGTNTGNQTITLTGDVTGSGTGSFVVAIGAGVVTLAQHANMATGSLFYRKTASAGPPEVQTLATLKADLGLAGSNSGDQVITLTGDVTGSGGGSFGATIAAGVVTLAKQANVASGTIFYRKTGGTGSPEVQTLSTLRADMVLPKVTSVASTATLTPTFTDDQLNLTAQAGALTLANPTGTAVDAWGIVIRVKDNGGAQTIAYGTQYRATGTTLPTTTVAGKVLYLGMVYNAAETLWDVVSTAQL